MYSGHVEHVFLSEKKFFVVAYAFLFSPSVFKFTEAPNAAAPFVEVPTPLWIWILSSEDAKSGMFTHQTPWLSESLSGIPFIVTLILDGSFSNDQGREWIKLSYDQVVAGLPVKLRTELSIL